MFFSYYRVTDLMQLINIVLDKIEMMHVDVMIDTILFKIIQFQHRVLFPNQKRAAFISTVQTEPNY